MKKRVVKLIVFVLFFAFIVFTLTQIYKTKKRRTRELYKKCKQRISGVFGDNGGVYI